MARPIIPAVDRFMQYVSPEPNSGCWLWLGAVNEHGYGVFFISVASRMMLAHRAAMVVLLGKSVDGCLVLHRCDTPSCVNPDHLMLGDCRKNSADMAVKGRGSRSRSGLPYGVKLSSSWVSISRPFYAQIRAGNKYHYLGRFATAEEAGTVAAEAKRTYYAAEGKVTG